MYAIGWWKLVVICLTVGGVAAVARHAAAQPQLQPPQIESEPEAQLPPPEQPGREPTLATPDESADLGLTLDPRVPDYAVVHEVTPGGAADEAGLQPGDTIEAVNGNELRSRRDLYEILDTLRPGEVVDIDFSRRITGRTQAVVEGRLAASQPSEVGEVRPIRSREPIRRSAYEELPRPRTEARGATQPAAQRYYAPPSRERVEQLDAEPDEPPRGRLFNRERRLLPWRRN